MEQTMEMTELYLKEYIQHLIWIGLSLMTWMLVKEFLSRFAAGLSFYWDKNFNTGDHVIIDGEEAIIVSIGMRETVFEIKTGTEGIKWRYVPNDRIKSLKIEKII